MPALYSVQVRTHTGSVREINEDRAQTILNWQKAPATVDSLTTIRGHLFAVADGMGGHAAGEIASQVAIETLFATYYEGDWHSVSDNLSKAVAAADQAIQEQAREHANYEGMGTTIVAAVLHQNVLTIANVGDSRAYLFHAGVLKRITEDHSWVEEQIRAGVITREEARRHPYRNVITRSLGPDRDTRPDLFHLDVHPQDRLLLCSDGLSNLLTDEELAQFLTSYPIDEAADNMLELALERGAPDNVTFVLTEMLEFGGRRRRRLWPWLLALLVVLALVGILLRSWFTPLLSSPSLPTTPSEIQTPTLTPPLSNLTHAPSLSAPIAEVIPVGTIDITGQAGLPLFDSVQRFGSVASQNTARSRPLRERYLFYVRGPLLHAQHDSQTWQLALPHQAPDRSQHTYIIDVRGPWLPNAHPLRPNDVVGIIGRPRDEDDLEGDIALIPLLIVDEEDRPLWVADGDLLDLLSQISPIWVYTVFGEGGGRNLGIATPPGYEGQPLVMWGSWSLSEGDTLQWNLLDPKPYVWVDSVYQPLPDPS
ncbi:MAG: Stp1/IreP family PP2C-type Ser/Thr phosphatase [Chloroflexi bacterium]|nr:Stp1/IreP family PP2C-type Ser/Thr phosphatase [Chloroflexota bacterium]